MEEEKKIKSKKKVDKSQVIIKVIALVLVVGMLIPTIASTIFYFVGE